MSRGRGATLDPDVPKICTVCGAPADGYHYGTMSCRSCNAFFRRTVMEKAEYTCRHNLQCIIDEAGRNACRFCRFRKCLNAGMKIEAVQPKRDPTGSQANRRRPSTGPRSIESLSQADRNSLPEVDLENDYPISAKLFSMPRSSLGGVVPNGTNINNSFLAKTALAMNYVKKEEDEEVVPEEAPPSSSNTYSSVGSEPDHLQPGPSSAPDHQHHPRTSGSGLFRPQPMPAQGYRSRLSACPFCANGCPDNQMEFALLVNSYADHNRHMQLCFASPESFLAELSNGPVLREMEPKDVQKLSTVELAGLMFWIEKMTHFKDMPEEDRGILFKRYSVRKLSLDHFYNAAKHVEQVRIRKFVMNNYTYVPPNKTGFETPQDDLRQMKAKKDTFSPTFSRFWHNVVDRFVSLKVTDAEIVFLHLMLMWSPLNQTHISQPMRPLLQARREWAVRRLSQWYRDYGVPDAEIRMGEMIFLFQELEIVCDLHCQDFVVAKMFEFCDLSDFWYETICYGPLNTAKPIGLNTNASDIFKMFAAAGYMMRVGADMQLVQQIPQSPGPGLVLQRNLLGPDQNNLQQQQAVHCSSGPNLAEILNQASMSNGDESLGRAAAYLNSMPSSSC